MLHQGQLMPVASPKADGLRLFLDNTLVLEATLLPHLLLVAVRNVVRLDKMPIQSGTPLNTCDSSVSRRSGWPQAGAVEILISGREAALGALGVTAGWTECPFG